MQAYYNNRLAANATLFDTEGVTGGGLHFDRTHVADTLEGENGVKGYDMYFKNYLETLPAQDRPFIEALLPNLLDWFVPVGGGGMSATAGAQTAFMLGGTGSDTLIGGSQADVLIGNGGADILSGGRSYDYLFGGAGIDTYIINSGDGNDTIIDEGRNILKINGEVFAGIFTKVEGSDSYVYTNGDQSYTLTFGSSGSSTLSIDGNTRINFLNQTSAADFADGQFGLTLWENEAPADFDLDLTGTAATNTSELIYFGGESVAYFYGFFQVSAFNADGTTSGNWLYSEYDLALDTSLTLSGGNGNDRLEGLLGADHLIGGEGDDALWGVNGALLGLPQEQQQGDWLEGGVGIDLLCGGGGEDMLYGGDDTDILAGKSGKDLLMGERGNDLVVGCAADDVLSGGAGNDLLVGDGGLIIQAISLNSNPYSINFSYFDGYLIGMSSSEIQLDTAYFADGDDRLFGGSGTDCLIGGLGNDFLSGDDDNDILWGDNDATSGSGGDDTLYGGAGDDLLYGAGGSDFLEGGSGIDELYGGENNDVLFGNDGSDRLWGDNPDNTGNGDDEMHGGAGEDILAGGSGDDTLCGNTGNDQLYGGSGNDTYVFSVGDGIDYIDDQTGQNLISFASITSLASVEWMRCVVNSSGAVSYNQAGLDILLHTNNGDSVVLHNGMAGAFSIELGDGSRYSWTSFSDQATEYRQYSGGNDSLSSTENDDRIYAGCGSDTVHGLGGNDAISGGNSFSNDFIALLRQYYPWLPEGFSIDWSVGDSESLVNNNDELYGDNGNDILEGGVGIDQLFGGNGDDALSGGDDIDSLYGEDGDDILSGGADGDMLYGGAGNDRMESGTGDDLLVGGLGSDYLDGGEGFDSARYNESTEGVVFDLNAGSGVGGEAEGDILVSIEYVLGSSHADSIWGNSGDNRINGGGGQDTLYGGDGDDVLGYFTLTAYEYSDYNYISPHAFTIDEASHFNGGNGNDTLYGGRYSEILIGGAGNDLLSGGMGHDIMQGGDGDDVFTNGTTYETPDALYFDIMEGGAGNDVYQADIYSGGVDIINDQEGCNIVQFVPSRMFEDSYPDLSAFTIGFGQIDMDQLQALMAIDWRDSSEAEQQLTDFTTSISLGQTWCPPDNFQDLYIANNDSASGMVSVILGGRNVDLDFTYDFGNGNVYTHAELLAEVIGRYQSPYYGEENDVIEGDAFDNAVWGGGGNDYLFGAGGNDTLAGESGNDEIDGGEGNDTLIGGTGNDYVIGNSGNDVYVFNRGDGQDDIDDYDLAVSTDTLRFGDGLTDTDILAIRSDDDLLLRVQDSADQVRLWGYFAPDYEGEDGELHNSKVECIEFANGVIWDPAMVQTVVVDNHAPTINMPFPAMQAHAGSLFTTAIPGDSIIDSDAWDSMTYSVTMTDGSSLPAWLAFDAATLTFSGTADVNDIGNLNLTMFALDSCGAYTEQAMTLNILPANRVPEVAEPLSDAHAALGAAFSYTIASTTFADPDGDTLIFSATLADGNALPAWLAFDPVSRSFSGTPLTLGTMSVQITATDAGALTVTDTFNLAVVLEPTLTGTAGSDVLAGGTGNDVMTGLDGNDSMRGNAGNDILLGGLGNDVLHGGAGADLLDGGEGRDSADYRGTSAAVAVNLATGAATGGAAEGDTFLSIENLYGTDFDDTLIGSDQDNTLIGYGGSDLLSGLEGNDSLRGEDGADQLLGGAGCTPWRCRCRSA
ncbi:putative Ig domain-containing protein [uncultured Desulfobulbus sp.]|uniref:putative Ig domain-containing protein n=1 Tax=uncultured Desulfobulbus sp. TaxID=239745 RepID=UPI0029C95EC9|nr:putative Ig domain-containing protein [uncultured Desulfobulbus sp.]